ncbi:hypothetical protein PR048_001878 [Dryococelus australis]|uniref:Uncharacterized protein n=1 Tax=Dryococelus australis TaxID=614101 RepID=A0ABQ9IIR5_9NEOP|nr:hypothetical protein PR048_001878 [Dryococelus australis]
MDGKSGSSRELRATGYAQIGRARSNLLIGQRSWSNLSVPASTGFYHRQSSALSATVQTETSLKSLLGSVCSSSKTVLWCVPLQMYGLSPDNGKKLIVWQNPWPSSTWYGSPIKLEFAAETTAKIIAEKKCMDDQIADLQPTVLENAATSHMKLRDQLAMKIIAGKICNALTETTSAQHAHRSAEISGLNEELITKSATVLHVLSSGCAVDSDAVRACALDTARLYVKEYSLYLMPTSPHKILIHGADVIFVALLPIGTLSEEAQDARNIDF